jgi:hypothetical protein
MTALAAVALLRLAGLLTILLKGGLPPADGPLLPWPCMRLPAIAAPPLPAPPPAAAEPCWCSDVRPSDASGAMLLCSLSFTSSTQLSNTLACSHCRHSDSTSSNRVFATR